MLCVLSFSVRLPVCLTLLAWIDPSIEVGVSVSAGAVTTHMSARSAELIKGK